MKFKDTWLKDCQILKYIVCLKVTIKKQKEKGQGMNILQLCAHILLPMECRRLKP